MNASVFAEWLLRQGHKVFQTNDSYWYDQGPRVYQAFPYHWVINPNVIDLHQFLRSKKGIGLRYSGPLDIGTGMVSYHAIFEESYYDFENLSKWARKNVRRGLKMCSIEPISFKNLADEGWLLQVDTLDRQGRNLNIEKSVWKKRCIAANNLPGFEACRTRL